MLSYSGFNDYYVEVFRDTTLIGVFSAVTNLAFLRLWLNINFRYRGWSHLKVYHRESRTLIGVYQKNGVFPAKPMA